MKRWLPQPPLPFTTLELQSQRARELIGQEVEMKGECFIKVTAHDPSAVVYDPGLLPDTPAFPFAQGISAFRDALDDLTSSIHHITSRSFEIDGQAFTVIVSKGKPRA